MSDLDEAAIGTIVTHMNDDHADSVADYARHYGDMEQVDSATLIGFDADAMRIAAYAGGAKSVIVIDFDHSLRDAGDARDTLIAMAREAATSRGLPQPPRAG